MRCVARNCRERGRGRHGANSRRRRERRRFTQDRPDHSNSGEPITSAVNISLAREAAFTTNRAAAAQSPRAGSGARRTRARRWRRDAARGANARRSQGPQYGDPGRGRYIQSRAGNSAAKRTPLHAVTCESNAPECAVSTRPDRTWFVIASSRRHAPMRRHSACRRPSAKSWALSLCAEISAHVLRACRPHPVYRRSAIRSMPADIFPEINIPVVTVIWQYTGLTRRRWSSGSPPTASTRSAPTSTASRISRRRR